MAKISRKEYNDAYMLRIQNNNNKLIEFAEKLKESGFKVFATNMVELYGREEFITYIVAEKNNKRAYIGFEEVPYRWYISGDGNSHENTKGLTGPNGYDFPFTIEEVSEVMMDIRKPLFSFYVEI